LTPPLIAQMGLYRKTFDFLTLMLLVLQIQPCFAQSIVLDGFDDLGGWRSAASEGARIEIAQDAGQTGLAMRLDFDLQHRLGYVAVSRTLSLALPENYEFRFQLRGAARPNDFQFKLLDSAGNVWWFKRRNFAFPEHWQEVTVKKRDLQFAWGPKGGTAPKDVVAVEFVIASGTDSRGSVWIDRLTFAARDPAETYILTPRLRASTSVAGHEAELVLDEDPSTSWRSGSLADDQWLLVDFLQRREYGGLVIDWVADDYAVAYQVQVSEDGENWRTVYAVSHGNGGRDYIYTPATESRYLRLLLQKSARGQGYGIVSLTVKPLEFSRSANDFFEAIAKDAPRGLYPRYFYGEQSYWTVVGVSGDHKEGLLNEDGTLEVDKGGFSIEPFLYTDRRLITWNSVEPQQSLASGYLPIPTVTWKQESLLLKITAFATGKPGASSLYVRYRLENTGPARQQASLFLAIRPFQVNPSWQSLKLRGGVSDIHEISYADRTVRINRQKTVTALTTPDRFGTAPFEQGDITDYLRENKLPLSTDVADASGFASGALAYTLDLPAGGAQEVYLVIPFYAPEPALASPVADEQANTLGSRQLEVAIGEWEQQLNRVAIELPPAGQKIVDTLKSTLAYILINRNGPAIQPGSRSYARSWIRDGALTSSALLELGHTEEVREFINWFAAYQFADGKIPCCVDERGADPVPEHDSHGEFIFLVMEYYRYTRDVGFLRQLWPHVVEAVHYVESLRQQSLAEEFKNDRCAGACYGLMPESISHEGYAAAPKHSYWDDFFILRGLKDVTAMATILGEEEQAKAFTKLRDSFREDLYASLGRTMAIHHIDYIPGCVELGDLDPASTTIAIDPGGELSRLPRTALIRTFDLYYEHFRQRKNGAVAWDKYAPYELRVVGSLIQLGQKSRALEILDFFLAAQRPPAWNQWAEVVWRDPRTPRFIGDMPHTWVGSDFVRSVRNIFAYGREADQALVIAAGIPEHWLTEAGGVVVKRLPTHYGTLNYSLRSEPPHSLRLQLSGDLCLPAGKIVFSSPLEEPLQGVTVNGKATSFSADQVVIEALPAEVVLHY
jgi:hypothetical protein